MSIRKNNERSLNIGDYETLETLPIYNEYFIISLGATRQQRRDRALASPLVPDISTDINVLYNSIERAAMRYMLQLTSQESQHAHEVQYMSTMPPRAPTNSFNIVSGLEDDGTPAAAVRTTRTTSRQQRPTTQRTARYSGPQTGGGSTSGGGY